MAKPEPDDLKAIEQKAVFLLGRREQSAAELCRKLRDKGFAAEPVEEVLAELQARGWQSDQRFAEGFIRQRVESGYGPLKIQADMMQKGVHRDLADQILEEMNVNWLQLAVDRYQRRFGQQPALDDKEKARRHRHLAARGFYPGTVYEAAKIAGQQESGESE